MLANYDAKAVASVMGLGFLSDPKADIARDDHFAIRVDGAILLMSEVVGFSDISGTSSPTAVAIEKGVEKGLPRYALRHLAEWLADGDAARVSVFERGIVPKTTLDRRGDQLSPQESERTERIARLSVHARRALGTDTEARDFMTTPHPELDGRTPVEAARTDLGARRTEQILNALEYGLAL